jgi:putative heme-binding domain-containing protein
MGNIHQNAINQDRLIPNGSSFKAVAEKDFLTTSDGWFRPISEQVGPDGALWIADWCDKYPCYQNARADPEGVDRERGRIWRVVYVGKDAGKTIPSRKDANLNLKKLNTQELVKLLSHQNNWHRRQAQRLLMEQRPANIHFEPSSPEGRLATLWTMSHFDGFAATDWVHEQPAEMRAWAARCIGEQRDSSADAIAALERLAADPKPSVRLAVATAVRQIVSSSLTIDTDINADAPVGKILTTLIKSSADAKDPLLPFMIWMASEPLLAKNPAPGLQWLAENGAATMPLSGILARKAMRRLCDTGETARMNQALEFLSAFAGQDSALTIAVLDGLIAGQKARALRPTLDTAPLFEKLNASGNAQVQERARQLGTLWGDAPAIEKTLAAINNPQASVAERTTAIQSARQLKTAAAREALLKLMAQDNPEPLTIEAIRALGDMEDEAIGGKLVAGWKNFTPAERAAAADVLVSRGRWVLALLSAIETKQIASGELSASAVQRLGQNKDEFIRQRAALAIGRIRPADADKQKIIAEKKKMIQRAGPPDLQAGYALAQKTCFTCHKLYGEGADVGPDLTGVGRASLDALLANVIDPNQIIGKGYESVEVETKDGRSVGGRLVEDTATHVKLLAAGPKEEVIARSDIERLRVSELSVMPEGLEQMSDADFRNLIGYILNASGPGAGAAR